MSADASRASRFAIEKRVRLRQARVEGEQQLARCNCLSAGGAIATPSGELEHQAFFVDEANTCVKALALSASNCTSRVVYRSPEKCVPRSVLYVPGADLLLVVEALLNRTSNRKRHSLLAATRQKAADGADSWRVDQRERLTTTPTAWDEESIMQLHALPDGRVLCGMSKSNALELFDSSTSSPPPLPTPPEIPSDANAIAKPKLLRSLGVLRLFFKYFCIAVGFVNEAPLLFAAIDGEVYVRVLRLSDRGASGPPTAQPLRYFEADASRLVWLGPPPQSPDGFSGGRLLCAEWKERVYSHHVDAWQVTTPAVGGTKRTETELVGSPLTVDDGFDIECWCALPDNRLLFNDLHRAELVLVSLQ